MTFDGISRGLEIGNLAGCGALHIIAFPQSRVVLGGSKRERDKARADDRTWKVRDVKCRRDSGDGDETGRRDSGTRRHLGVVFVAFGDVKRVAASTPPARKRMWVNKRGVTWMKMRMNGS